MKKQSLQFLYGAIAMMGLAACSDTNDVAGDDTQQEGYTTTIQVTAATGDAAQAGTRALTPDANNNIVSDWVNGDKMFIYDLNDADKSKEANYSLVTMAANNSNKKKADFIGKVKSVNAMNTNHELAFFYPGTAVEGEKTVEQVDPTPHHEKDITKGIDIKYHTSVNPTNDVKYNIRSTVSLDMKKQDGTLTTIDQKFDYNWGKAKPTEVKNDNGQKIVKTEVTLNRKVTIWGLKFKIVNNPSSTGFIEDIDSVKINGLRSYDVLNLSDGSFVGTSDEKEYMITVANKDQSKIKLQNGYVWVAFLAENASTNFTLTVYTQSGVYTKTASKLFNTGYDYRSNITVEKITPQPYVTVNNVRWATGNFIHYKKGSQEYWGIAPAQWWISNYGDNPSVDNRVDNKDIVKDGLGSQHWYIDNHNGRYTQTSDDLDLFRWGDITEALNLNSDAYLGGTGFTMDGNYYKNKLTPGGWFNRPVDKSEAKFGDIVKYYTEKTGRSYYYKYPTLAQLEGLQNSITKVPAFCYTDKGNKIYGIYYSDYVLTGQHAKFPTGKKLWKYEDVTGLVLANRGLFLPVTGRRNDNVSTTVYRHVAEGSNFMGFYYADRATALSTCKGLFFGSLNYGMTLPQKQQACAIRPVYDGPAITGTPPVTDAAKFAPFSNIIDATGRKY
ncbi:hypothetical protein [Prevotella melaninogenica]|uniref:Lipoprotein n=1 Tax=Prevotella melaninogenica TaxID=28132 RepID=A0A250KJP9_9BACT|nr:hypothetical protein [Prevotella melaninogenica]BBA29891.1 hypothetical protein PMEL_200418 [Prevotella melaninogenica]